MNEETKPVEKSEDNTGRPSGVVIKSIYGRVIFESKHETIKEALVEALESNANLRDANLRDANLRYAKLSDADLRYANLSDAKLSDADLRYADLRYAKLSDADLRYANLSDADLRYADLRYAKLSYAKLSYAFIRRSNHLLSINGLRFPVMLINDGTAQIGCQTKTIKEWLKLTESDELSEYDFKKMMKIVAPTARAFCEFHGIDLSDTETAVEEQ